jgi:hypothetical protein
MINENILNQIDERIKKLGLTTSTISVKPCHDKFLFNKEKNSIILDEKEINDNCNYIASIHLILNELNPKKPLYFINFADFTPAVIVLYFQIISKDHTVILFCNDYKELQQFQNNNFKIFEINEAEKYNLIKRRDSASDNKS